MDPHLWRDGSGNGVILHRDQLHIVQLLVDDVHSLHVNGRVSEEQADSKAKAGNDDACKLLVN